MIIARLYAAAYTDDINTAIHFIDSIARPWTTLMAVGFDYGAHMFTKYLAEGGGDTNSYGCHLFILFHTLAIGYVVTTTKSVKLDLRMKALRVMDTKRSTKMMVAHHHHLNLL
ncbi:hypothetical protein Tco_0220534 [Tanacetum coccineum]